MALELPKVYMRRGCVFTVTIRDADDAIVPLDVNDVVRVKVGKPGSAPILDFDSLAPSAGGSTVTFANPTTVTINGNDLVAPTIVPGDWDIEVGIFDNSQGLMLHADSGPFSLFESQLGDIAGT